ncbi:hypothetical protein P7C70_g3064, partial [Phenoliferia sp. Uapishka_3]
MGQLISRGGGVSGPIITLNAVGDKVFFSDKLRGCETCESMDLSDFVGKTTVEKVAVTYGPTGSIKWQVQDAATGETMLEYSATGNMGSKTSMKFGTYRAYVAGLDRATAYVGDYSASPR